MADIEALLGLWFCAAAWALWQREPVLLAGQQAVGRERGRCPSCRSKPPRGVRATWQGNPASANGITEPGGQQGCEQNSLLASVCAPWACCPHSSVAGRHAPNGAARAVRCGSVRAVGEGALQKPRPFSLPAPAAPGLHCARAAGGIHMLQGPCSGPCGNNAWPLANAGCPFPAQGPERLLARCPVMSWSPACCSRPSPVFRPEPTLWAAPGAWLP